MFIEWLLNAETPTIRYLTARDLLDLPPEHPYIRSAQQALMTEGPVPTIFAQQTATGQWANEHSFYTPKYVSIHWSLMLLTELCVDPTDSRFQRGVAYMLTTTPEKMPNALANYQHGFSCFWGNLLRYALYAGWADDPRVGAITEYIVHDLTDGFCHCKDNDHRSCAWGVVRSLWGLALLPPEQRTADIQTAIDRGVSFLLDSFNLLEANYPTPENGKIHPLWFKLNFPLFYQTDILFTLRILAELKALNHPGATPALDWLDAQRGKNGYWRGSNPFRQRTWRELGDAEETARWVSLHSALILKHAGRLILDKHNQPQHVEN